jgi:hypothetical protein
LLSYLTKSEWLNYSPSYNEKGFRKSIIFDASSVMKASFRSADRGSAS